MLERRSLGPDSLIDDRNRFLILLESTETFKKESFATRQSRYRRVFPTPPHLTARNRVGHYLILINMDEQQPHMVVQSHVFLVSRSPASASCTRQTVDGV